MRGKSIPIVVAQRPPQGKIPPPFRATVIHRAGGRHREKVPGHSPGNGNRGKIPGLGFRSVIPLLLRASAFAGTLIPQSQHFQTFLVNPGAIAKNCDKFVTAGHTTMALVYSVSVPGSPLMKTPTPWRERDPFDVFVGQLFPWQGPIPP